MKKLLIVGACLLASFSLAGDRFVMRLISDPVGFDWNVASTPMDTYVALNIMEGLVQLQGDSEIKPAIAKSWVVSTDRKTYTFKLRNDVKWSDGKPLTAAHFVDSWKRLLDPATAAPYAYFLFDIVGAQEFNTRKLTNFNQVGIKALDAFTFRVELKKPLSYFLFIPTFWITFPIRKDLIQQHGSHWTEPANLVVNGPFKIESYQPQHQIALKRNPLYYDAAPQIESVIMRIITDNSTAVNLYKSKQLDFLNSINPLEVGSLTSSPEFHTAPYFKLGFLGFNLNKAPANKVALRQAIGMSIDRTQITRLFQNAKQATNTLVPRPWLIKGRAGGLEFNPTEAKLLLKKNGIDPSTIKVQLLADSTDDNNLILQFLQQELRKNLGIQVDLDVSDYKTFKSRLDLMTGTIYLRSWGADYPDPDTFMSLFLSDSGNNRTGYSNQAYDDLVKQARFMAKTPARTKTYSSALNLLLNKDAAVIPLYFDSHTYLLNPKIKNFKINALNYIFLKNVSVAH